MRPVFLFPAPLAPPQFRTSPSCGGASGKTGQELAARAPRPASRQSRPMAQCISLAEGFTPLARPAVSSHPGANGGGAAIPQAAFRTKARGGGLGAIGQCRHAGATGPQAVPGHGRWTCAMMPVRAAGTAGESTQPQPQREWPQLGQVMQPSIIRIPGVPQAGQEGPTGALPPPAWGSALRLSLIHI